MESFTPREHHGYSFRRRIPKILPIPEKEDPKNNCIGVESLYQQQWENVDHDYRNYPHFQQTMVTLEYDQPLEIPSHLLFNDRYRIARHTSRFGIIPELFEHLDTSDQFSHELSPNSNKNPTEHFLHQRSSCQVRMREPRPPLFSSRITSPSHQMSHLVIEPITDQLRINHWGLLLNSSRLKEPFVFTTAIGTSEHLSSTNSSSVINTKHQLSIFE